MDSTKNATRISSLLGTWSGQTRMKALVGDYELLAYFVVHLMADPLRGYGCSLKSCSEIDNHVCVEQDSGTSFSQKCANLQDGEIPWSDISAFLYFGARVDAGVPFNVHLEHNTGGWVGPLSIILAQNTSTEALDQYVVRYAETPATPYLHMNPNCTLFAAEDFEHYMGPTAVRETVEKQTHASYGQDPYEDYLKTCDNGDVKPILPLYDFVFVNDTDGSEKLEVRLDYKILTFPQQDKIMYKLFPKLQERFNRRKGEFHISGPYCYGDDPKRGWTFDFNYDSKNENEYMTLVQGCLEGLPCLPAAAEISVKGPTTQMVHVDGKTATFGSEALLTFLVYTLSMALLLSIGYNCRQSQRATQDRMRRPAMRLPGPYGDLVGREHESLSQPLLTTDNEDAVSESKEADEDEKEADAKDESVPDVQFV